MEKGMLLPILSYQIQKIFHQQMKYSITCLMFRHRIANVWNEFIVY